MRLSLKVFLSCFTLLWAYTCLPAQSSKNPHVLLYESGAVLTTANLQAFIAEGPASTEITDGYYFRVIQFDQLPASPLRKQIEATGLRLMEYMPNNAYLTAIPQGYDRNQLNGYAIRAVLPLEANQKVRPLLRDLPLPEWAVKSPGTIDLALSTFGVLDLDILRNHLRFTNVVLLPESEFPGVVEVRAPVSLIDFIAAMPFVRYVEPINPPAEAENYTARTLHRANGVTSEHPGLRNYNGSGVSVAVGDDGFVGPHIDFTGRINNSRVTSTGGNHGDHCTGTVGGAGNLDPTARGMAWGSTLEIFDVWDAVNQSPSTHTQNGVMITSTSYSNGCNAGYTNFARSADQSIHNNPALIHVFSAGNDGNSNCGYGAGSGWGNVTGGVKVGKNVIAVGNLNFQDGLAGSSSRGPAADGRIKPEVCAKGTQVWSTQEENNYASLTGTSMACPGVAGVFAVLYDAFRANNGGDNPPSGLLKGILMNTAEDLGNPGPDFRHGYGRINALRAVNAIEDRRYMIDSVDQAGNNSHTITVPSGTSQLRVMVYWHDAPGTAGATKALVNDLNITLSDPSNNIYNPWVLDPTPTVAALNSNATRGVDDLNNQEQVTLDNPPAGTYTVTVNGQAVPQGPQTYFLTYEIIDSAVTVTFPTGGEGVSPNSTAVIRWDAHGDYGSWLLEYSLDNGTTWNNIAGGINGEDRTYNWSVPSVSTPTGKALVRVSRGGQSDVSEFPFSIIGIPRNLRISAACPNYFTLAWDSMPEATEYKVYRLGNTYMDSVGITSNASFDIPGVLSTQGVWVSVKALGPDDAEGERAIAIFKTPGVSGCTEPNDVAVDRVTAPGAGLLHDCLDISNIKVAVELKSYSPNDMTNIPVSFRLDNGAVVTETYTDTLPGYGTDVFEFTATASLSGIGNHVIESWTSFNQDTHTLNDTTTANLELRGSNTVTLPWTEDFETFSVCGTATNCENGTCVMGNGWNNATNRVTDEIDWRTDQAGTPSNGTGPSTDHNPGTVSGKYIYLEASSCFERASQAVSPCIDLTNAVKPELRFWFHLYGSDMGELHVDVFANGQWNLDVTSTMRSDWFDIWWERDVDLSAFAGQKIAVRWRGITGPSFRSDMAIDDISVTDLATSAAAEAVPASTVQVYPNPSNGNVTLFVTDFAGGDFEYNVRDLQGKQIRFDRRQAPAGNVQVPVNLEGLPQGIYLLELNRNGYKSVHKIAIQ